MLFKEYSISFYMHVNALSENENNILQLNNNFGDQLLSIFVLRNYSLKFFSLIDEEPKINIFFSSALIAHPSIRLQISQQLIHSSYIYAVRISYNYAISVSEMLIYSTINKNAQDFSNVDVYASGPLEPSLNGTISQLKLITGLHGINLKLKAIF